MQALAGLRRLLGRTGPHATVQPSEAVDRGTWVRRPSLLPDMIVFSGAPRCSERASGADTAHGLAEIGHRIFDLHAASEGEDGGGTASLAGGPLLTEDLPVQSGGGSRFGREGETGREAPLARLREEFGIVEAVCLVTEPCWGTLALALRDRYRWKVIYAPGGAGAGGEAASPDGLSADQELRRRSDLVVACSGGPSRPEGAQEPIDAAVRRGAGRDPDRLPRTDGGSQRPHGDGQACASEARPEDAAIVSAAARSLYPTASVVIVTHNNLSLLRLCLQSIVERTGYPALEVIVVDNGSTDATPQWLEEFAEGCEGCRVVMNSTNEGFARAANSGALNATGSYLVFLNDDTVVTRGWLSGLLRHLRDPAVGMVGPVTNWSGNESRIPTRYRDLDEMESFAEEYARDNAARVFDIDVLAFFCVAMRRPVFDEVGPLDERFGIGMFEDDDYALRLRQKGYRLICAEDVFVHHWGRVSFAKLGSSAYRSLFTENLQKFEHKWARRWQPHRPRCWWHRARTARPQSR